MINLLVDEGYAFDYLSILTIKSARDISNQKKSDALRDCVYNLITELGQEKFSQIIMSQEYIDLEISNSKTFDAVDKARYGDITAKEVDSLNMERFKCKQILQKKFFNTETTEAKS